jgi:hypothetical protein
LRNPLNVEISLCQLTLVVKEANSSTDGPAPDFVKVEVLDDVTLGPNETRTVGHFSLSVTSIDTVTDPYIGNLFTTGLACYHARYIRVFVSATGYRVSGNQRAATSRYPAATSEQGICSRYFDTY